jgi:uncharacterized protein (TIGR03435 family)
MGAIALLALFAGFAQSPAAGNATEFEAATVKRVAPTAPSLPPGVDPTSVPPAALGLPTIRGGPGTSSPGRIRWANVTLMYLIMKAYDIYADQVHGADRLISDRYTVEAIVPSGATVEQFQQMLQNLLLKRFRLTFRWEERDFKVYRLTVAAGGPKLRPSAVGDPGEGQGEAAATAMFKQAPLDEEGCPMLPLTRRGAAGRSGGSNCATFVGYSMSELADELGDCVGHETNNADLAHVARAHVKDETGLKGRFDFNLNYNKAYFLLRSARFPPGYLDAMSVSDSIFKVVQNQLGLKLEPTTSKLRVMLIEHVESDPAEN